MRRLWSLKRYGWVLIVLAWCATARAQDFERDGSGNSLTVAADRNVVNALAEAGRMISQKQYHAAVQNLQFVLDRPEDEILSKGFLPNRQTALDTKGEATRLLLSMPEEGRAAYELEYGATARALFAEARDAADFEGVAEVMRRFALTSTGYDATVLLAARSVDRGDVFQGALLLESLREHPLRTPQLLLQTAAYWMYAGQPDRCLPALHELKRLNSGGKIRIGGRDVDIFDRPESALNWLRNVAGKSVVSPPAMKQAWSMPGGGVSRNESAAAASPVGGNQWRVSLFEHLTLDGRPDADRQHRNHLRDLLQNATQSLQDENRPIVPMAQPLVIGNIVVYRTVGDVTAVSLQSGKLLWRSASVDDTLLRLLNARTAETRNRARLPNLGAWSLESLLKRRIYRDAAAGTLTSDGQTVYGLEQIDVSAMASAASFGVTGLGASNKLVAYDLAGGRMLWEVGGPRGTKPGELSAHFFLGPPLPLDGRLYVLAETQGSLQLIVLEQDADRQSVREVWSQTLIATASAVTTQPLRRFSGLSPSESRGIIVCPTSSGAVVAVDLIRRVVLWGHPYHSAATPQNQGIAFGRPFNVEDTDEPACWLDAAPVIADGRVLATSRDSDQLYCLDLVSGRQIWTLPRGDLMFVACVVDGRVVLVGRRTVEAVRLVDGKPSPGFETAEVEAVGRGIRSAGYYCLPTINGEIATLDLQTGRILARSKLPGAVMPGNLVAGNGTIVSQSADELIGFASMTDIERRIADELRKDPQDSTALALRGELRLHRGDQEGGLADLRASLRSKTDPHVKSVVATALLAALRINPESVRDHAAELEAVTDDPQQRNEFLRIYAGALEKQGDRRGAFEQLIRLAETSQFLNRLDVPAPGHSVRLDRSIRAHLIDLYAAASADERTDLDRIVERKIRRMETPDAPVQRLERSLKFLSGVANAESLLLNWLVESSDDAISIHKADLLRPLQRSSNPAVAAQSTALECRELVKSGRIHESLPLIRRLQDEFASQICLDGRTGQSLFEEYSARKEFRPLLSTPTAWTGSVDFQVSMRSSAIQRTVQAAEIVTRIGTQMANWSFETESINILQARDADGRLQWKLALMDPAAMDRFAGVGQMNPVQIHIMDNWLAVSLGSQFLIVDASTAGKSPRIAWRQSLRTNDTEMFAGQPGVLRRLPNNRGFIRLAVPVQQWTGQFVGLSRETAVYAVGNRLFGAELESGQLAWVRQDIVSGQFDASIDDRVVVIQQNNNPELTLLRTLDGKQISKRTLQRGNESIWVRGARQLALRMNVSNSTLEMRDVEREVSSWTRQFPANVIPTVVDDEDVAVLDATGLLSVVRLADGQERYRVQLPMIPAARERGWIAIQRCSDRDIVLVGEEAGEKNGVQSFPFEMSNSQPGSAYNGYVCGVSRTDGRLLWSTPVEQMVYDRHQPSGLPILLLAARQIDRERIANRPFARYRIIATVIDKRNGRKVYSIEQDSHAASPRLEADPENRRIVANFHDWQVDFTFSDASKAVP